MVGLCPQTGVACRNLRATHTSRGSANALTSAKACDFILSVPIVHPLQSRHCVPVDELSTVQLTFVVAEADSPCCNAGAALG